MNCADLFCDMRLSRTDLAVLGHLMKNADAVASRADMAVKIGCAPNSIPRSAKKLEGLGLIQRVITPGERTKYVVVSRNQDVTTSRNDEDTRTENDTTVVTVTVRPASCVEQAETTTTDMVVTRDTGVVTAPPTTPYKNITLPLELNPERPELDEQPKRKRKAGAAGTRMTPDWQPSREDVAYAAEHRIVNGWCLATAENFRDYWLGVPGSKGLKADWPATWRSEVRKEAKAQRHKPASHGGSSKGVYGSNGIKFDPYIPRARPA